MDTISKILFVLLLFFLFPLSYIGAQSFPSIPSVEYTIQDQFSSNPLPDLQWILEEQEQALDIDALLNNEFKDAKLIKLSKDTTFKIKSHTYYWFHLRLNASVDMDSFALDIHHAGDCWPYEYTYKEVDAYCLMDKEIKKIGYSGTARKASERDFTTILNPSLILLNSKKNTTQDIWVKVIRAETCNIMVKMELKDLADIYQPRPITLLFILQSLTHGAIIALFLVGLCLLVWFKEKMYLLYILFLGSLLLAQIGILYRNELFNLFFQNHPRFFVFSISILAPLWLFLVLLFGRVYINTKEKFPRIHFLLGLILGLFIFFAALGNLLRMIPFSVGDFGFITVRIGIGLFLFSTLFILIYLAICKDKFARMYSRGILLPFAAIFFAMIELIIYGDGHRDITVIISSCIALTMALAIAYRFRAETQAKEIALNDKLSAELETTQQLQKINIASNKFVPQAFLQFLGKENILEVALGDYVEKQVTVLFSDIRDYTTLSESMTPEENFRFVTAFNQRMGPIIQEHKGFINQYLGDGIMAIFPNTPEQTLEAAITMQQNLIVYNDLRIKKNQLPIKMGIGIHTGPLIMGIIGDDQRLDAATISDAVNISSRIESLTKHYGVSILLSEDTYQQIKNKQSFHFRYLGKVLVKGKQKAIGIYECFEGNSVPQMKLKKQTLNTFNEGLYHYFDKNFGKAAIAFQAVLVQNPFDKPAILFLRKSNYFKSHPVDKNWFGIEIMDKK